MLTCQPVSLGHSVNGSILFYRQFYINGNEGIMLIETESLRVFLSHADFTSETVLEEFWQRKGSILLLISELKFKRVRWIDLPHTEYAVISYQWKTKWGSIAKFIFGENGSPNPVRSRYLWLDLACLNQLDGNRMATIRRSDEIYFHSKEYHLMEVGSLTRGWVLFELSSVPMTLLPITHFTTTDAKILNLAKSELKRTGFEGCKFSEDSDRDLVRAKILEKYTDMDAFNEKSAAIVDTLI